MSVALIRQRSQVRSLHRAHFFSSFFCRGYLAGRVSPGTRVSMLGVYSIKSVEGGRRNEGNAVNTGAIALRTPYIRVVGLTVEETGRGRTTMQFRREEEEEFLRFAREGHVYDSIWRSIEPSIFGHEDIKRALTLMLVGGTRKMMSDSMRIRGDVNVLLLGDPGTAKSQFLKFIAKVAPVAIYTSGKGSSAAGLTASVMRDASHEFYLEGGAMVLADGGIVCIDEFDKMNVQDRVAIHEAMEQQTISIAKAGITTILNSRTAVLAAANPIFGSYDDLKTAAENIDFQTTILSRFDLIFVVHDVRTVESDKAIATHVIDVHRQASTGTAPSQAEGGLDIERIKRYVAYCRSHCFPQLSPEGCERLKAEYVRIRSTVRQAGRAADRTIPITVRQLEALVRLSEAYARLELSPVATEKHVEEALRLFKAATLDAANSSGTRFEDGGPLVVSNRDVEQAEEEIKKRLPVGEVRSERRLIDDLVRQGILEPVILRALKIMVQKDLVEYKSMRKALIIQLLADKENPTRLRLRVLGGCIMRPRLPSRLSAQPLKDEAKPTSHGDGPPDQFLLDPREERSREEREERDRAKWGRAMRDYAEALAPLGLWPLHPEIKPAHAQAWAKRNLRSFPGLDKAVEKFVEYNKNSKPKGIKYTPSRENWCQACERIKNRHRPPKWFLRIIRDLGIAPRAPAFFPQAPTSFAPPYSAPIAPPAAQLALSAHPVPTFPGPPVGAHPPATVPPPCAVLASAPSMIPPPAAFPRLPPLAASKAMVLPLKLDMIKPLVPFFAQGGPSGCPALLAPRPVPTPRQKGYPPAVIPAGVRGALLFALVNNVVQTRDQFMQKLGTDPGGLHPWGTDPGVITFSPCEYCWRLFKHEINSCRNWEQIPGVVIFFHAPG
ncbi:putative DNA replication licensing factor MCM5 [Paratrimastix pyriformis]|uniref:DNA replication licensing factor MCM5 n=1 Tax=Paratrimastix pyriformis TaxID=342808 RepID=A0ABQ8UGL9_9EUKA|nr:putative DNA replication licensing factor MCM5 [Paratrimastix pyriformis]